MPDILEQDLTEEEQRRLEEEQALAEMQQLLASRIAPPDALPQEAIPAENVSFTNGADGQIQIDTPEGFAPAFDRQMIGDERYQQELARAQRGSGFLAPDVGPSGNVITAGYDPAVAEAAQRRQQAKLAAQAERFMGVQGYQQSIQSGATPAEALALWGAKMYSGDPEALASVVTRREPATRVPTHKPQWGKVPAQIQDRIRSLDEDERAQQAVLTRGTATGGDLALPLDDAQRAEIKANMQRIRAEKQQILSREEFNSNIDQTGFSRQRWDAADVPRPTVQQPTKQEQKDLTVDAARDLLKAAGGDKAKARKMALDQGYRL